MLHLSRQSIAYLIGDKRDVVFAQEVIDGWPADREQFRRLAHLAVADG